MTREGCDHRPGEEEVRTRRPSRLLTVIPALLTFVLVVLLVKTLLPQLQPKSTKGADNNWTPSSGTPASKIQTSFVAPKDTLVARTTTAPTTTTTAPSSTTTVLESHTSAAVVADGDGDTASSAPDSVVGKQPGDASSAPVKVVEEHQPGRHVDASTPPHTVVDKQPDDVPNTIANVVMEQQVQNQQPFGPIELETTDYTLPNAHHVEELGLRSLLTVQQMSSFNRSAWIRARDGSFPKRPRQPLAQDVPSDVNNEFRYSVNRRIGIIESVKFRAATDEDRERIEAEGPIDDDVLIGRSKEHRTAARHAWEYGVAGLAGKKVAPAQVGKSTSAPPTNLSRVELFKDVSPRHMYIRPTYRLQLRAGEGRGTNSSSSSRGSDTMPRKARLACLYAGFMRDFQRMLDPCTLSSYHCLGFKGKRYGNQRRHVLQTTDCDVFISTWDIVGGGKFDVRTYNMRQRVDIPAVYDAYGSQLTVLHVQRYDKFQGFWRATANWRRSMPQSFPGRKTYDRTGTYTGWVGFPENWETFSINDYSQTYKHWAVVRLADYYASLWGADYDAYMRMRPDLRASRQLMPLTRVPLWDKKREAAGFRYHPGTTYAIHFVVEGSDPTVSARRAIPRSRHVVDATRIHASSFEISDFGFIGQPWMIRKLANTMWAMCTLPSEQLLVEPKDVQRSEYNLVLWNIIFQSGWQVDDGLRYLVVSRQTVPKKKRSKQL